MSKPANRVRHSILWTRDNLDAFTRFTVFFATRLTTDADESPVFAIVFVAGVVDGSEPAVPETSADEAAGAAASASLGAQVVV